MVILEAFSEEWKRDLEKDLVRFEGYRGRVYDDATGFPPEKTWQGKLTVGYGWNIEDTTLPPEIAKLILRHQVSVTVLQCELSFAWFKTLSPNRKRAVVNLAYNMGIAGLKTFKRALTAMSAEMYQTAADHFLDSRWREQVGEERANFVVDLIRAG
jgi:lysozyme